METYEPASHAPVPLLWTGGWDSTFQLLRLLLQQRRSVQPYYLEDGTRPSTGVEIATMARIRETLAHHFPHTVEEFRPTRYCSVAELPEDAEIERAYAQVLAQSFMGNQYAWLARFCRAQGVRGLQLCIHRDDKAHAVLERFATEDPDEAGTWRCDPAFADTPQFTLFGAFRFPLFELTKLDMARVADEHGWKDLMGMTWFCHKPRKDMTPCGVCNPCLYTIEEGLGWRIPRSRRALSALYRAFVLPAKVTARGLLRRTRSANT